MEREHSTAAVFGRKIVLSDVLLNRPEKRRDCDRIRHDISRRNFYCAQIRRHDDFIFILQNIHYPYAAFAGQDDSGGFVLTSQSE